MPNTVKGKEVVIVNLGMIQEEIELRVTSGVNRVGERALDKAMTDVPQRKVFRYGRTKEGLRFESRQSTRTLTPQQVRRERGRAATGMRYDSPQAALMQFANQSPTRTPKVDTTYFEEFGYRSRDKANTSNANVRSNIVSTESRRGIDVKPVLKKAGPGITNTTVTSERFLPDPDAMADLSTAGRYELNRRHTEDDPTGKGRYKKGDFVHKNQLGGGLRRSIKGIPGKPGRRIKYVLMAGNDDAPYAKYVEFGTRHAKAQPFLRPALAHARTELMREVLKALAVSTSKAR